MDGRQQERRGIFHPGINGINRNTANEYVESYIRVVRKNSAGTRADENC